jgi:hypothetical protein
MENLYEYCSDQEGVRYIDGSNTADELVLNRTNLQALVFMATFILCYGGLGPLNLISYFLPQPVPDSRLFTGGAENSD